ncbi:hypothetical protein PU560_00815, partial [Georgenia sp. 10Sc9-8]|nr:hypothetical protein [Georgenia halotolerans]
MSPTARAAASVLGAGLLVVGEVVAPLALAGVLLVVAVLFAVGWPRLIELPTTRGPAVVVVLAVLASLSAVLLDGTGAVAVVAGLAVVAAFVHQMLR